MSDESIYGFQVRAEHHCYRRLAEKDREIARARRALAASRLDAESWRRRALSAVAAMEALRDEYRDSGANHTHYVAILAALRARRAVEYIDDRIVQTR